MNDFSSIGPVQMTIFIIVLCVAAAWDAVWKVIAMWHSARRKHLAWFIFIAIFNTLGILPIIYLLTHKDEKDV